MLENEQLLNYVRLAKSGDENAKEILFKNNAPLLKSIVRRFIGKGVEYDDLYQIASIGFLKAINNFDESFNVKFSTYTVPMVIGEIKRYMRDNGAIKVSRAIKTFALKLNKFIDEYQAKIGNSPSIELLSSHFNVNSEEIVVALESSKMPLSIFEKYEEDDGQELIEKIPCKENEDSLVNKIHLSQIIDKLSDREKKIIMLRYYRDKTQGEIAEELGVSQVQVSRLENKIIDKIRLNF